MGNWIQLTSGGGYDFETKSIFGRFTLRDDVAWPLGAPRFTRHTTVVWPVTLHSVAVARTIEKVTGNLEAAAAGLLHDCHEAVIGDITTPVGRYLDYERLKELKHDVHAAIFVKLGVPFDLMPDRFHSVELADQAALHVERKLWTPPEPRAWTVPVPSAEYMQTMFDVVRSLDCAWWRDDDGVSGFLSEYERLVKPLVEK